MDPYEGSYGAVMTEFTINDKGWKASRLFQATLSMETVKANAYIGLFEEGDTPTGRTRLLHAPRAFPVLLGKTSPYDHEAYALLDDVVRGTVQVVEYIEELFHSTSEVSIPVTGQDASEMWSEDEKMEFLPALEIEEIKQTVRVPKMMYVPPKYIHLFLGKRFTPRQLFEEFYPVLVQDEQLGAMQPFVTWMMVCATAVGKKKTSPCLLPDVTSPIADARFIHWTRDFLDQRLNSSEIQANVDLNQAQLSPIMAQMVQMQQQLQVDMAAAHTKTNKSVCDYFKTETTTRLMILCDVVLESDLPDVWTNLASNSGKRDRQIIEMAVREKATELGMKHSTPIITPNLAKKITDLRLVGNNMDDLDEGINPFSTVIIDNTTGATELAYRAAV
jgi:hypothetical protein